MNILNMKSKKLSAFESVAREVAEFKRIEDDAKASRLNAEALLVSMIEQKSEGTIHEEDGNVKVSVTYKLNRTVDAEAVIKDWNELPAEVHDAFEWKPQLVLKQARALESANTLSYAVLAKYITTKPAKPSVKVEVV